MSRLDCRDPSQGDNPVRDLLCMLAGFLRVLVEKLLVHHSVRSLNQRAVLAVLNDSRVLDAQGPIQTLDHLCILHELFSEFLGSFPKQFACERSSYRLDHLLQDVGDTKSLADKPNKG